MPQRNEGVNSVDASVDLRPSVKVAKVKRVLGDLRKSVLDHKNYTTV